MHKGLIKLFEKGKRLYVKIQEDNVLQNFKAYNLIFSHVLLLIKHKLYLFSLGWRCR